MPLAVHVTVKDTWWQDRARVEQPQGRVVPKQREKASHLVFHRFLIARCGKPQHSSFNPEPVAHIMKKKALR